MATANVPEEYVEVTDLETLSAEGHQLVTPNGTAIALFHHDEGIHAVDNQCPHMGFPLIDGSVEDGILTCHWHHARFELSCGDTFDPWADDVLTYPVRVDDGRVFVDPAPDRDLPPAERWADRLDAGLRENLRLVVAKSIIGLDDAGVDPADPVRTGLEYGTQYRHEGWSSGLTVLAAMTPFLEILPTEDRRRALYTGLCHVASDCAGEPQTIQQPAFDSTVDGDRLERWFRDCIEVRDRDGAERCLRTAVEHDVDRQRIERMLFAAATDHIYLDAGHTLDFINKAIEALDFVDWTGVAAGDILASLVPRLTDGTRYEEQSQWRQPIDLAALRFDLSEDLDEITSVPIPADENWQTSSDFRDTLLGDDPEAIVETIRDAIGAGAAPAALADAVVDAAATRVAQFGTANEFGDWDTVHHTFTFANAVREAALRTQAQPLYRGLFDAALNVYLDRFLNSPPAPIPEPDCDRDPGDCRDAFFDAIDTEGEVDRAGSIAAEWLAATSDPSEIWRMLGHTLLREDAGFHTLQNYEAGYRQFHRADSERARRTALVAVARYQAAHFPTRREADQTFTIAARLHRGETIHE
jgi:nitrite reductase/ring-hydroxylating ferredoxin subunit